LPGLHRLHPAGVVVGVFHRVGARTHRLVKLAGGVKEVRDSRAVREIDPPDAAVGVMLKRGGAGERGGWDGERPV